MVTDKGSGKIEGIPWPDYQKPVSYS